MPGKGHPDNLGRVLGFDRPGGGMPTEHLATLEQNALRRLSPRRNRWPELLALDERVAELEQRQRDTTERLQQLRERLAAEPTRHAAALAQWELKNRKGSMPESAVEYLERAIADADAEFEGLTAAITSVLAEKTEFVEKHRGRLVKDADKATGEAHERVLQLVAELEQARADLVELRTTAVFAALFPSEFAGRGPNPSLLAGGLAKPVKETLGINIRVETARLLDALRADADYWREATTADQRLAMQGLDPNNRAHQLRGLAWVEGTPEGNEIERAEKQAARQRYAEMWGHEPAEF